MSLNEKKAKEFLSLAFTVIIIIYVFVLLKINSSLFKEFWWLTYILLFTCSILIPMKNQHMIPIMDKLIELSLPLMSILIILYGFVVSNNDNSMIKLIYPNALYSIGWVMLYLFMMMIISIVSKHYEQKSYKEMCSKLSIFLLFLIFATLVSLICGSTMNLG